MGVDVDTGRSEAASPSNPAAVASGTVVHQSGLFDVLEPAVDTTFADARRIELDATSWIEHVPGWMTGSEALFRDLLDTAPWEQRSRWMYTRRVTEPRLTAEFPDIATVSQAVVQMVVAALSAHYGVPYASLWVNLYRDHRDSTSWHGDVIGRVQAESVVPVLSLGATRRFLIRRADGGPSRGLRPAAGDLIVMGGRCQRDWRHCVPKQATAAGPRISVNFAPGHATRVDGECAAGRQLLRARDLCDARYAEPLSVSDLAAAAGLSSAQFSRQFKRTFGESPHQYLLTRRLERAAALLRTSDWSIAEICFSVGSSSLGSFCTSFRRMFGTTPRAYRASHPPPEAQLRIPRCVAQAYGRPQNRTFREDGVASRS